MQNDANERERIVAWLRDCASDTPPLAGIRGFLWALLHPLQFGKIHGRMFALVNAANAIERGEHLKGQQ